MPFTPIPSIILAIAPRAVFKLANSQFVTKAANEVSQPVATYGATVIVVQATCVSGDASLRLEQGNDLDNWTALGASPLLDLNAGDTDFAVIGGPVGGGVVGARYVRLRFASSGTGIVTAYLALAAI